MRSRFVAFAAFVVISGAGQSSTLAVQSSNEGSFLSSRPERSKGRLGRTMMLREPERIWRQDGAREQRKEERYWSGFREREEVRFLVIYRAATERALRTAHENAIARARMESVPTPSPRPMVVIDNTGGGDAGRVLQIANPTADQAGTRTASDGDTASNLPAALTQTAQKTGEAIGSAASNLASAIEQSFGSGKSAGGPGAAAVILALLAMFLIPGLAGVLMALAYLSLRGGHRLQASVFAAAGLFLGLLIYDSVLHRHDADETAHLQRRCQEKAITISASVQEITDDGAVLSGLRSSGKQSAATNRDGCAFLLTEKSDTLSMEQPLRCVVYPVGNKKIYNIYGVATEMPAYTDSFDDALAYETQVARSGWWWEKVVRSLRQS